MTSETVYLVTEGSYSDYHVIAVFTDKEKAARCKELYGDADIEEYALNEMPFEGVPEGLLVFDVDMYIDGTTHHARQTDPKEQDGAFVYHDSNYRRYPTDNKWNLSATVYARDQTHAVKIVNEKRAALIAADRWPKNEEASKYFDSRDIEDW